MNRREIFLRKGGLKSTVCGQMSGIGTTVCGWTTGVGIGVVSSITNK